MPTLKNQQVSVYLNYIIIKYSKYPPLIIHLIQILRSQKTKAEIETGDTIEYDVTSYQVKKTTVKSTNTTTATSFSFS